MAALSRSSPKSVAEFTDPPKVQIIEDRYIDEDKLLEICKQRFAPGTYKLRVGVFYIARVPFSLHLVQIPQILSPGAIMAR